MSVSGKPAPVRMTLQMTAREGGERFLAAVDRLREVEAGEERDELIAVYVYNMHNGWLRAGRYPECKALLAAYIGVAKEIGFTTGVMPGSQSGNPIPLREGLAGDACALWNFTKDDSVWELVEALLPETITLGTLAYNLACSASLRRDRGRMLGFIRQAVALGKPRQQFLGDSDFEFFHTDPDFLTAIG